MKPNPTLGAASERSRSIRRRLPFIVGLAIALFLAIAGSALADTATLTVNNAAGQPDPAAGLPRVFTVSGTTTGSSEHAYVKYRAIGGAGCAPTADSDTGTILDGTQGPFYSGSPSDNGAFTESDVITWPQAQTLAFCIWIAPSPTTATTPFTQTVTFRPPTGTIGATVSPKSPVAGQQFTVTVSGASEAPEVVFATLHASGAACAPTFAADSGSTVIGGSGQPVNGSFAVPAATTLATAGGYQLCLWLASSASDASPVAGPDTATFTVTPVPVIPPPPCSVPNPPATASLAVVEQALLAAHCAVGTVTRLPSPTVHAGNVIGLSPAPLSQQATGTAVAIEVSTGPACVVPRIRSGATVAATKRAIRAAHCSVGRVTHRRSLTVRRSRVIRISPAAGAIGATNAAVAIVESTGRHG